MYLYVYKTRERERERVRGKVCVRKNVCVLRVKGRVCACMRDWRESERVHV